MDLWIFLFLLASLSAGAAHGCGLPEISPHDRIVNGVEAVPHSWPWQASLAWQYGAGRYHYCGASLINESWILTAAHCDVQPDELVTFGLHNLSSGEYDIHVNHSSNADEIQIVEVAKVFTHPRYDCPPYNYDVQLVKLASPVKVNRHVSPVCLAETNDHFPSGTMCVTTGWGRTSSSSWNLAEQLQQAALPLLTNDQCREHWGDRIKPQMICAGGAGASSCHGDSGGPLVCQKDDGAWTLVGVVNWGHYDCKVCSPGVYARVSELRTWIDETMAAN